MIIFVILLSGFVQGNSVLPALAVEISIDIDQPCIGVERDPAAAAMDAFNPGTEFLCSSHLLTGQISGELRIVPVVVPSNQKQVVHSQRFAFLLIDLFQLAELCTGGFFLIFYSIFTPTMIFAVQPFRSVRRQKTFGHMAAVKIRCAVPAALQVGSATFRTDPAFFFQKRIMSYE